MAKPALEVRQKAQAKWLGASVHSRGKGWIKHQHPTEPLRQMYDTQVGARWHFGDGPYSEADEIDTAWQSTTGAWDYEMTLNDFQTYARDTFNVGDIFEFQAQGESLRFDPHSINWVDENYSRQQIAIKQAVTASVDDDKLIFTDAYGSGRHFQYQNQTARLQKLITIDSAANLPAATLQGQTIHFEAEFSMSLSSGLDFYLDGVLWERKNNERIKTVNNIEVRDEATGTQVLWWLGLPTAYDSPTGEDSNNETIGELEVRRQGGPSALFITIRIPKTWIDAANFPIYIDPTVDYQVDASANDAKEETSGFVGPSATNFDCDIVDKWHGHRWTGVTIDDGATIDAMTVDTYLYHQFLDEPYITLDFEDGSAPAQFVSVNYNISSRTGTTATGAIDENNLGAPGWMSELMTLTELKTIGQELVDSYDYSGGSSMVCREAGLGGDNRDYGLYYYDQSSTYGAKLHIEFTAPGGAGQPMSLRATTVPHLRKWTPGFFLFMLWALSHHVIPAKAGIHSPLPMETAS